MKFGEVRKALMPEFVIVRTPEQKVRVRRRDNGKFSNGNRLMEFPKPIDAFKFAEGERGG